MSFRRNGAWVDEEAPGSPSKRKFNCKIEALEISNDEFKENSGRLQYRRCWSYFKEFTENTSLHGLKYIGEGRRSIVEKIWWCIMIIMSMIACAFLIFKVWNKWQQSPVIVSFAETFTPVWQVPFPAITVCSENKVKQTSLNITELYHKGQRGNLTDEDVDNIEKASLLCTTLRRFSDVSETNITNRDRIKFMESFSPSIEDLMWLCFWKTGLECGGLFNPILTEDGLCFTFNMLGADELLKKEELHTEYSYLNSSLESNGWSLDGGYPKNLSSDTYPFRTTISGSQAGVGVLLRSKISDLDYICRGPVQGYKIYIHNPAEVPRSNQNYIQIPFGQEVVVAIKPNMMTTSEGLRNYAPHRRQCYYPSERILKYYKIYTQQNCEWECLTNFTMGACGCVSIFMPREKSMPICNSDKYFCTIKAQEELSIIEINKGVEHSNNDEIEDYDIETEALYKVAEQCQCLPACTGISYDAETSQGDFDFDLYLQSLQMEDLPDDLFNCHMSRVRIFFKESQFITHRRSELYGQTDFLANCGGLLGLFLGFSLLSLIEIIYFFTLRLLCTIKMKLTKKRIPKSAGSLGA